MSKRRMKGTKVYEYLGKSGILETGSPKQIEEAKKQYWATIRKQWKQLHRNENKSYTIFLKQDELKLVTTEAKKQHSTVTTFIKQAALLQTNNNWQINKKLIGEMREAVVLHACLVQQLGEEKIITDDTRVLLENQIEIIEQRLRLFIKQI